MSERTRSVGFALALSVVSCRSTAGTAACGPLPESEKHWPLLLKLQRSNCVDGDPPSCAALGVSLNYALHGVTDRVRGVKFLECGCTSGSPHGCAELGVILENGRGVAKDEAKARRLYDQACKAGHTRGCSGLAYMLERGAGGPKDYPRALTIYEAGCTRDDPTACNNLGRAFQHGDGRPKNLAKAGELYEKACAKDYPIACGNLGKLQRDGAGVPRDVKLAEKLFLQGCRSKTEVGRAEVCLLLDELVIDGHSTAVPLAEAKRHAEAACAASIGRGCLALAKYRLGHEQDPRAAQRDLRRACELGIVQACEAAAFSTDPQND